MEKWEQVQQFGDSLDLKQTKINVCLLILR